MDPGSVYSNILGKHDGDSGYLLLVDGDGKAKFRVSSGNLHDNLVSNTAINDGAWHHVLVEMDRDGSGSSLNLYLDGSLDSSMSGSLTTAHSLANEADFVVGAHNDGSGFSNHLSGAIDYMRVCRGTLADAETSIEELYAWQSDGPFRYDSAGKAPIGRRDAGALEAGSVLQVTQLQAVLDIASGEVALSWQNNTSATDSYLIERSTSPDFSSDHQSWTLNGADITSWTDDSVDSGTPYYYRVTSEKDGVTGPVSRTLELAWGTEAPAVPSDMAISIVGDQISVDWGIADEQDYVALPESWSVQWTDGSGSSDGVSGLTTSDYAIAGIDPSAVYHITVTAVNGAGSTATQEFSAILYEEDFSGTAIGSLPADWSSSQGLAVQADPSFLVSPSGTPMATVSSWNDDSSSWNGAEDLQYVQVETVCARGDTYKAHLSFGPFSHLDVNSGDVIKAVQRAEGQDNTLVILGQTIDLLPDEGETVDDVAFDTGEFWTLRLMVGPSADNDPARCDIYLQILDQDGNNRIDGNDNDINDIEQDWAVIRGCAKPSSGLRGLVGLTSDNSMGQGIWFDSFAVRPFNLSTDQPEGAITLLLNTQNATPIGWQAMPPYASTVDQTESASFDFLGSDDLTVALSPDSGRAVQLKLLVDPPLSGDALIYRNRLKNVDTITLSGLNPDFTYTLKATSVADGSGAYQAFRLSGYDELDDAADQGWNDPSDGVAVDQAFDENYTATWTATPDANGQLIIEQLQERYGNGIEAISIESPPLPSGNL
ncbi:MAG: LamG domain-containing protein [Planctomycetota bacterium]